MLVNFKIVAMLKSVSIAANSAICVTPVYISIDDQQKNVPVFYNAACIASSLLCFITNQPVIIRERITLRHAQGDKTSIASSLLCFITKNAVIAKDKTKYAPRIYFTEGSHWLAPNQSSCWYKK
jgi:hypothetical protein